MSASWRTRQAAERRGRRSETWAALFLMAKGYRILGRRVRTRAGEIDLVARSPRGVLCFVEVKARAARELAVGIARAPPAGAHCPGGRAVPGAEARPRA